METQSLDLAILWGDPLNLIDPQVFWADLVDLQELSSSNKSSIVASRSNRSNIILSRSDG